MSKLLKKELYETKGLLNNSPQKMLIMMLNECRESNKYNFASLFGYFIFASLRNRFVIGVCYLLRRMDKFFQQKLEEVLKYKNNFVISQNLINADCESYLEETKQISEHIDEVEKDISHKKVKSSFIKYVTKLILCNNSSDECEELVSNISHS